MTRRLAGVGTRGFDGAGARRINDPYGREATP